MFGLDREAKCTNVHVNKIYGSVDKMKHLRQEKRFFCPVYAHSVTLALLLVNLPPTLAKSQVSSVRKNLKMQMLSLLKHPRAVDYLTNITTLLTDLGATQSEVGRSYNKTISKSVHRIILQIFCYYSIVTAVFRMIYLEVQVIN